MDFSCAVILIAGLERDRLFRDFTKTLQSRPPGLKSSQFENSDRLPRRFSPASMKEELAVCSAAGEWSFLILNSKSRWPITTNSILASIRS